MHLMEGISLMRTLIRFLLPAGVAGAAILAIVWLFVLPRIDWSADKTPSSVEIGAANAVLIRSIAHNAGDAANPLQSTPENLKAAKTEYEEHCAACHAVDGGARNGFEADFYPPVAKLTGDIQKLSDSEIYFIVAKGIRYTAMPAFEKNHSPDDIWRTVLWVRHLANLTPQEKADMDREMQGEHEEHEGTMEHGKDSDK